MHVWRYGEFFPGIGQRGGKRVGSALSFVLLDECDQFSESSGDIAAVNLINEKRVIMIGVILRPFDQRFENAVFDFIY